MSLLFLHEADRKAHSAALMLLQATLPKHPLYRILIGRPIRPLERFSGCCLLAALLSERSMNKGHSFPLTIFNLEPSCISSGAGEHPVANVFWSLLLTAEINQNKALQENVTFSMVVREHNLQLKQGISLSV